MKLRIAIVVCILTAGFGGWLLLHPSGAAPSSTEVKLYLNPAQLTGKQGQTFSEAIRLSKSGNQKVDYVSAQLTFPAQLISVRDVSRSGSAFNNGTGLRVTYNNNDGTFSATGSGNAVGSSADELVVTITFLAKAAGQANLKFSTTSQAGALLGNNSVKNALDTMVGSIVSIAAATSAPSPTTGSGSGSTGKTPQPTNSNTKSAPVTTTPAAKPDTTSVLNDAPHVSDTTAEPTSTSGVITSGSKVAQTWPWLPWLLAIGLILGLPGGVLARLFWVAKKHPQSNNAADSDSQVVAPQPETDSDDDDIMPVIAQPKVQPLETPMVQAREVTATTSSQPTIAVQTDTTVTASTTPVMPIKPAASAHTNTPPRPQVNSVTPPAAKPPVPATGNPIDDTPPDMFDDGEKRLKSEGL